jgi:hypothetical protein
MRSVRIADFTFLRLHAFQDFCLIHVEDEFNL